MHLGVSYRRPLIGFLLFLRDLTRGIYPATPTGFGRDPKDGAAVHGLSLSLSGRKESTV
jgi:hypothetical protein